MLKTLVASDRKGRGQRRCQQPASHPRRAAATRTRDREGQMGVMGPSEPSLWRMVRVVKIVLSFEKYTFPLYLTGPGSMASTGQHWTGPVSMGSTRQGTGNRNQRSLGWIRKQTTVAAAGWVACTGRIELDRNLARVYTSGCTRPSNMVYHMVYYMKGILPSLVYTMWYCSAISHGISHERYITPLWYTMEYHMWICHDIYHYLDAISQP